jgi:hypothetical protein
MTNNRWQRIAPGLCACGALDEEEAISDLVIELALVFAAGLVRP